jgi:hypothetical protein
MALTIAACDEIGAIAGFMECKLIADASVADRTVYAAAGRSVTARARHDGARWVHGRAG